MKRTLTLPSIPTTARLSSIINVLKAKTRTPTSSTALTASMSSQRNSNPCLSIRVFSLKIRSSELPDVLCPSVLLAPNSSSSISTVTMLRFRSWQLPKTTRVTSISFTLQFAEVTSSVCQECQADLRLENCPSDLTRSSSFPIAYTCFPSNTNLRSTLSLKIPDTDTDILT